MICLTLEIVLGSGKQGNVEQQHPSCEYHQKAGEADCAGHERTMLSGHSQSQGSGQGVTRTEQTPASMSQPASAGTATAAEGKKNFTTLGCLT
jgi:hypothetical protein